MCYRLFFGKKNIVSVRFISYELSVCFICASRVAVCWAMARSVSSSLSIEGRFLFQWTIQKFELLFHHFLMIFFWTDDVHSWMGESFITASTSSLSSAMFFFTWCTLWAGCVRGCYLVLSWPSYECRDLGTFTAPFEIRIFGYWCWFWCFWYSNFITHVLGSISSCITSRSICALNRSLFTYLKAWKRWRVRWFSSNWMLYFCVYIFRRFQLGKSPSDSTCFFLEIIVFAKTLCDHTGERTIFILKNVAFGETYFYFRVFFYLWFFSFGEHFFCYLPVSLSLPPSVAYIGCFGVCWNHCCGKRRPSHLGRKRRAPLNPAGFIWALSSRKWHRRWSADKHSLLSHCAPFELTP